MNVWLKACAMLGLFIFIFIAAIGFGALFAWPVKWLWNGCLVPVTGAGELNFWKAWGLLVLSGLLVKSNAVSKASKE